MKSTSVGTLQTPFCGALRSKKYFMLDVIATEAQQYLDESGHCWCYHTQHAVGPDGELVQPLDCTPGRSCYRSAVDKTKC
jgi:hypothetical protein